jgi:hypothetical protein
MSPEYQEYYHQLLATIRQQKESEKPEMEKVEGCFKASLECWGRIRTLVKQKGFEDIGEEILFFKEVKPLFTSHIEYYTNRYHALLFMPIHDARELHRFWEWEMRKIERFYENNREFCCYIRQGQTHKDAEYFLRGAQKPAIRIRLPLGLIHDQDADLATSHDHLATMISAYNLYEQHIQTELGKLNSYIVL